MLLLLPGSWSPDVRESFFRAGFTFALKCELLFEKFKHSGAMRFRIFFGLVAATIAFYVAVPIAATAADSLADSQAAYQRADYTSAARLLPPLAAAGNPSARTLGRPV